MLIGKDDLHLKFQLSILNDEQTDGQKDGQTFKLQCCFATKK